MKIRLSDIVAPIVDDLKLFHQEFENALRSEVRLVNTMVRYVLHSRGKHIRPILTILSAHLCGQANLNSLKAATLVEILHIATLVHDDVVDESDLRRNWPSLRRVFNNKKAVLIGDYFLAKSLSNIIRLRNFRALEVLSNTAERLSSGEILQLEKALLGGMTEEVYYQMVKDKTASLFGTACELGAITASEDQSKWEYLRQFGENLGIAFQIKDDLFDLTGEKGTVGKPVAFDVKKNVRTLPLIYALKQLEPKERRQYLRALKSHARRGKLTQLRGAIEEGGGIDYANKRIQHFSDAAIESLASFSDSEYKTALINIVHFNAQRTS
ncbi:MAG: polyprenyl synthetase family protein [Fidelibacterota bacterium]|nr:MAG: polyprenyl synthetase family protein [Candidatus Neomarinimicrobiota bacterium]